MAELTTNELRAEFERMFGTRPSVSTGDRLSRVLHDVDQTVVDNELMYVRLQLSRATGDQAQNLRLNLEAKIRVARACGYKA